MNTEQRVFEVIANGLWLGFCRGSDEDDVYKQLLNEFYTDRLSKFHPIKNRHLVHIEPAEDKDPPIGFRNLEYLPFSRHSRIR